MKQTLHISLSDMKYRIKECTRCHNVAPHHHELDYLCMQCEMEIHYPDDKGSKALITALESSTLAMASIEDTKEAIKKLKPKGVLELLFKR